MPLHLTALKGFASLWNYYFFNPCKLWALQASNRTKFPSLIVHHVKGPVAVLSSQLWVLFDKFIWRFGVHGQGDTEWLLIINLLQLPQDSVELHRVSSRSSAHKAECQSAESFLISTGSISSITFAVLFVPFPVVVKCL